MMTTNISESFNSVLKGARGLPIQALVQKTFYRLNKFFVKRREDGLNWESSYAPTVEVQLRVTEREARRCQVIRFSRHEFQVTNSHGHQYTVNLGPQCGCSCNVYCMTGLPCVHIVASCRSYSANISHLNFCAAFYSVEAYRQTYGFAFHPVLDSRHWPPHRGATLQPPFGRRQSGRPRSRRLHMHMDTNKEGSSHNHCSHCGQPGHYRSTCPGVQPPHHN